MPDRDRTYCLDSRALSLARVPLDAPLCLARSAWGASFAAAEEAPEEEVRAGIVAVISICGPLAQEADSLCGWYDGYGGETGITARVLDALSDSNISAVVLRFDSPGGTSAGLEEAIRRICAARNASGKPILAYVDEQCCSAAYWIAAAVARDGIHAPRSGFIGSIGTWVDHTDMSGAMANEGLRVSLIADPPGKVAGNPFEPLGDVGRTRLERSVRECTGRFFAAVSAARGISIDDLRKLDGDVLEGEAALGAKLIDGIASLEDVIDLAAAIALNPDERTEQPPGEMAMARSADEKEPEEDMPISDRMRAALGLGADASDAAAEAATMQLAGLGRHVLVLTGAVTPEAARGVVAARFKDAAEVPALREQLAAASAGAEESTRFGLLEQGIRDGKITPSLAFSFEAGEDGQKIRRLSAWASAPHRNEKGEDVGQSLGQLRAYLAAASPGAFRPSQPQKREPAGNESPADDDAARAAAAGVSLESYLRSKRLVGTAIEHC